MGNSREENEVRFPGFARFMDDFRKVFPEAKATYVENLETGDKQGKKHDGIAVQASPSFELPPKKGGRK